MLGHSTVVSAEPLEYGDAGVSRTVEKIREIVNDAWRDLDVRAFAIKILKDAGAPQYDDWSKARAIYDWITHHFYFVLDPVTKEVLMPFPDLVQLGAGDCDEINATAMAVLLGVIGYEPRLVTIAADASDPQSFSHVYVEALIQGNWIPMDAARPGAQIGVAPPSYFRRAAWSLRTDECWDYPGPGMLDGTRGRSRTRLHGYVGLGYLGQDASEQDPLTGESYIDEGGNPISTPDYASLIAADPSLFPGQSVSPSGSIDWTSIIKTGLQDTSKIVSALRTPKGPGGNITLAPSAGRVAVANPFGLSTQAILIGGGLILLTVYLTSSKRSR